MTNSMIARTIDYDATLDAFAVYENGQFIGIEDSYVEAERMANLPRCRRCGPTEWPVEPDGRCTECTDHAARFAAEDARNAAIERAIDAALAQQVPVCRDCGQTARLITHHQYAVDGTLIEVVQVCVPCHRQRIAALGAARAATWPQRGGRRLWWKNASRGRAGV